jgi:hypothetical protein
MKLERKKEEKRRNKRKDCTETAKRSFRSAYVEMRQLGKGTGKAEAEQVMN